MTSREKFEAWWVKGNDGCQPRSGWEKLRTDDGYNDEFIDFQYEGFKAAEEVFQQQLEESRREFRAADATIHNLELQLTDMAVQLANAESKCRELAAELSAVDKIHNEAVFITDEHYEQCPPEVQKMIRSLAVLQIPAYQAFLAEVRAQGVEMYAVTLDRGADDAERDGFDDGMKFLRSEAEGVRKFAAQLRQGVQS